MDIHKLITPSYLKRVETHIIKRTTTAVPYKKYDKIIHKIPYCRKPVHMNYFYYLFNMINDDIIDCLLKGKLRYTSIQNDHGKLKKLKKDIPLSLKMKILHIIENRYIMSKLDIYTYKMRVSDRNRKKTFYNNNIVYFNNIIYLLLSQYIMLSNKYYKLYPNIYLTNNIDNSIYGLYLNIVKNTPETNIYFKEYRQKTNIETIIHQNYNDESKKYDDYVAELKKYDNFKLMNKSINVKIQNINNAVKEILHTQEFKDFVLEESKKFKKYKFNATLYKNMCKKAGILKEYENMIKKVDSC